jgi:hypothetical protein
MYYFSTCIPIHIESENIDYLEIEMTSNISSTDNNNNNNNKDNTTIGNSKNHIKADNSCKLDKTTI